MNRELEKRGPHREGRAQGDHKRQVYFLPALVSWGRLRGWCVHCGHRGAHARRQPSTLIRSLTQQIFMQHAVPCPCGADSLAEGTAVSSKHTDE